VPGFDLCISVVCRLVELLQHDVTVVRSLHRRDPIGRATPSCFSNGYGYARSVGV